MPRVLPFLCVALVLFDACKGDEGDGGFAPQEPPASGDVDLLSVSYAPETYDFKLPDHFPGMEQPADNPATVAGVELGRHLFFDPILSRDSTFACASCHEPELAFTDGMKFSKGIDGLETPRSSMSLINVGFQRTFFWDGRSGTLEEQSLHPVEDPIELGSDWSEVETRLRRSPDYQRRFREAFGIERKGEVDRHLVAKAIAQFERSLVSATSRYDKVVFGLEGTLTEEELAGEALFNTEPSFEHPGCSHCHNAPTFGDERFLNNGLDSAGSPEGFADFGRGGITGNPYDNGKFRAPSLRNIELTAPYMHDGRFATLDEVLDHYSSGGHYSPTIDPQITGFPLSEADRASMLAFLRTLTDVSALERPGVNAPK